MFLSECYNGGKTDIISNLAIIEDIEKQAGIENKTDKNFELSQVKGLVDASLFVDMLTIPMKIFDNIGTTFSNPYGELKLTFVKLT